MKLTFEIQGYFITIEETEEGVLVAASKDDETVEEFTLELGEETEGEEDFDENPEMQGQGQAQGQAQSQELPEGDEEFDEPLGESKLESFTSFIKKRG